MITGKRQKDLVAELKVREHTFLAGLVEKLGGHDEGPNPHEYVEAALTACTIITGQMYANKKGWKLDSINVKVKILEEGDNTIIGREISYEGMLSEEERKRMTDVLSRCPILKLLESNIKVQTTVA